MPNIIANRLNYLNRIRKFNLLIKGPAQSVAKLFYFIKLFCSTFFATHTIQILGSFFLLLKENFVESFITVSGFL